MTRAASTKLYVEKYVRFYQFHEMFMNHIENMGWITSLVFNESRIDYNIVKDFGQVILETIETNYQALKISTLPTDNIKRIRLRGLYTWLLNSSDELAQYFLSEESENHHQSGIFSWKLLTTKILRGVKQKNCCVQNMIHALSFDIFDYNINSFVKALKVNCKLLASCEESKSSILENLLKFQKKSPSSEFTSYIRRFQDKYDDDTNIDLDDIMRDIIMKYE